MQTSMGMRWETLHVVIDSRPEEVDEEVFTFAVYPSEQGMYPPPVLRLNHGLSGLHWGRC